MKEKATNIIRVERARFKITQGQLASNSGCSRQTIHAIECGKFNPSITKVLRIIRYFNELRAEVGMDKIIVEDVFELKNEKL